MDCKRNKMAGRMGFTLIELLVVVTIIVILIAILIPALGAAKRRAKITETIAQLSGLSSSIEQYNQVFNAYPGPAPVSQTTSTTAGAPTGTQNLLIGLSYSMMTATTGKPADCPVVVSSTVHIDAANPSAVLDNSNTDANGNARSYPAFFNPTSKDITASIPGGPPYTWNAGGISGAGTTAAPFPTIIDHFGDPLPILYYRRVPGVSGTASVTGSAVTAQPVGTSTATAAIALANVAVPGTTFASYYFNENQAYTSSTGLVSPSGNTFPQGKMNQDILAYDVASVSTAAPPGNASARGEYVLIGAGPDRVYGTADDIVKVGP